MTDDLYQAEILDHYQHPHNFGAIKNADHSLTEGNQSCGDNFTFQVKLSKNHGQIVIKDIAFTGVGCAISTAASSLLTDHLKGKSLEDVKTLNIPFMQRLIGAEVGMARIKCLTLPARALQQLLTTTQKL